MAVISNDILHDIVTSVTEHETWRLASDFHLTDVVQRLDMLHRCSHDLEMSRLRIYLNVWKTRLSGQQLCVSVVLYGDQVVTSNDESRVAEVAAVPTLWIR